MHIPEAYVMKIASLENKEAHMNRYDFACANMGPAVVKNLLADDTTAQAFEMATGDSIATQAYEGARDDLAFQQRLETNKLTADDLKTYLVPIFSGFACITDPSAKKSSPWKYLQWICRTYIEHNNEETKHFNILSEDLYKIKDDLKDFEAFAKQMETKKRSIANHKSYAHLRACITPLQQKRDRKRAEKEKRRLDDKKLAKITNETTVIYDGPEGKILVPHTADASIYWGQETRWCTAAERSTNYFRTYNEKEPLWLYMPSVKGEERAMFSQFSSFKFTGTQGKLYDEEDNNPKYLYPFLDRLIDAALKTGKPELTKLLKKYGGYKTYKKVAPTDPDLWSDRETMIKAVKNDYMALDYVDSTLWADAGFMIAMANINVKYLTRATPVLTANENFIKSVVADNWKALSYATPELQAKKDIVKIAVTQNGCALEYAADTLQDDREIVKIAVTQNSDAFFHISAKLEQDRDIALIALRKLSDHYAHRVGKRFPDDEEIIRLVIPKAPNLLEHISDRLKADKEILIEALSADPGYMKYAAKHTNKDKELMLAVAKNNGYVLECVAPSLKEDRDIVLAAVKQNGLYITYATEKLRADKEIALAAVKQNGMALEYAAEHLKADKDIVEAAVKEEGTALQFADHTLRADEDIVFAAYTSDEMALAYASLELRYNNSFKTKGTLTRGWNNVAQGCKELACELLEKTKTKMGFPSP